MIKNGWFYESIVAQQVFEKMLAEQEARLRHLPGWHPERVETADGLVTSAAIMEDGTAKRRTPLPGKLGIKVEV